MESRSNRENRTLELQGRHNLEMGIHLAWEDEMNELEGAAVPEVTPEQTAALLSAVHTERDRIKAEKKWAGLKKNFARWGVAAAAILIATPVIAMNVSASRTAISNYVIQTFDKYSVIQYDKEYNAIAPFGWRSEYYPRWLPEGYQLDSVEFADWGDCIWYITKDKVKLSFRILNFTDRPMLNSEKYTEEQLLVNGHNATLYRSEDKRRAILFVPLSGCAVQIDGLLSKEHLVRMMESVEIP